MFFSITHAIPDDRFFINYKIKDFYLNLDSGWKEKTIGDAKIFYKGYCDYNELDDTVYSLLENSTPSVYGNFCAIIYNDNNFCITHDIQRHFPIWNYDNSCLTNLSKNNENFKYAGTVETDGFLSIDCNSNFISPGNYIKKYNDKDIEICKYKIFDINEETKSLDTCSREITDLLSKKRFTFNNSALNKKIFLSGGLDTMLVYALTESESDNFLCFNEHIELDSFLLKNRNYLTQTHGFYRPNTYHHWTNPTFLTSGAGAGYSFFKEYYIVAVWCAYYNIDFIKSHAKFNFYQSRVYNTEIKRKTIENAYKNRKYIQTKYPLYKNFCKYLLDISLTNYQHHHCGNTIMWTPLQDIRIMQKILTMNRNDIDNQIIHNNIEKYIIEEKNKNLLNYVSTEKNCQPYRNLIKFMPFKKYLKQILKDKKVNEIEEIQNKFQY